MRYFELGAGTNFGTLEGKMGDCSFEKLLQLLSKDLSLSAQLKVYEHLDRCEICRDTLYLIARDRDEAIHVLLPSKKRYASPKHAAVRTLHSGVPATPAAIRDLSGQTASGTMG